MDRVILQPASKPLYIRMHDNDNVAIVVNDGGLPAGTAFPGEFVLTTRVPQGHKIALTDIAEGAPIIRYDVVIGYAVRDIEQGSWVEESVVRMPPPRELDGLPVATRIAPPQPPLTGYTFEGYRNADGSVATRNILAITTTVQCVAGVVEHAVKRIKAELLPRYPNVDDVVALEHTYGCGVAIDAPGAEIPIRTLRNISLNPNFGGQAMVVSLGCEKLQPQRLLPESAIPIQSGPYIVTLQDEAHVGFESMIASILAMATARLEALNRRTRETCSAAELVVGVQCGGSDAFSGVTANPAVGYATDLLTARAASQDVADAMIREMAWYDAYLQKGGVDRSANTTPGNKKGGLANITEKAMGSTVKSGSSTIAGVLSPGEKVRQKGLIYAATPASDFVCGTLQLAAGMNLHVFTTGRGTPYGLAAVPVIKVATRDDLARRWHDLMDVNAGRIATGEASIADVGWELFQLMLDVASGSKTWAEHHQLHNALTLFNPAPIT